VTRVAAGPELNVAPGSIVVVRDEEWLVTSAERGSDGWLVRVRGLTELAADTTAAFYTSLDYVHMLDPAEAQIRSDHFSGYRDSRLWLESMLRKTPIPYGQQSLTVSTRMLTDSLGYQQATVAKALDPAKIRPRILLADSVGLGKTIEIGMILSELVRRGRGERILIVTPRHVLEQMQHELWCRFALPLVRLDSIGTQKVRQKLPATRNPFTSYKRAIISIGTLKQQNYRINLSKHRWDAVVIDESHNLTNVGTQNNALARLLAPNTEALILASATPHNGRNESFAELLRLLDPTVVGPTPRLLPCTTLNDELDTVAATITAWTDDGANPATIAVLTRGRRRAEPNGAGTHRTPGRRWRAGRLPHPSGPGRADYEPREGHGVLPGRACGHREEFDSLSDQRQVRSGGGGSHLGWRAVRPAGYSRP
jgi:hypothetical protein